MLGDGVSTGEGKDVIQTQMMITLETECAGEGTAENAIAGELPYNQRLGTQINRLRHKHTTDPATVERASYYVVEKMKYNVTKARITGIVPEPDRFNNRIKININYSVLDRKDGKPIAAGLTETVAL